MFIIHLDFGGPNCGLGDSGSPTRWCHGGWCGTKYKHSNAGAIFLGKKSRLFETWNWSKSKVNPNDER